MTVAMLLKNTVQACRLACGAPGRRGVELVR